MEELAWSIEERVSCFGQFVHQTSLCGYFYFNHFYLDPSTKISRQPNSKAAYKGILYVAGCQPPAFYPNPGYIVDPMTFKLKK